MACDTGLAHGDRELLSNRGWTRRWAEVAAPSPSLRSSPVPEPPAQMGQRHRGWEVKSKSPTSRSWDGAGLGKTGQK